MSIFAKGERLRSAQAAIELILEGSPLYRGDKLLTRKYLLHQQLHDLVYWTAMGEMSTAVVTEEEED